MSLLHVFSLLLVFNLTAEGYYSSYWTRCLHSAHDLSDLVYIRDYIFNKDVYIHFNSTVGLYVGYTEHGVYNARLWNNNSAILQAERAEVESVCRHNAEVYQRAISDKTVRPKVQIVSEEQWDGKHPAVLMCSAYDFYPPAIQVTWMVNNKQVTTDVTSTEEMPDGDWYYQIHSQLEYTPTSGMKIQCVVEHASVNNPIVVDWDPSIADPERNKIAIGASGLVLGIIMAAAGLIYYKRKSGGRILVPTTI